MSDRFLNLVAITVITHLEFFWCQILAVTHGGYVWILLLSPVLLAVMIALLWQDVSRLQRFGLFLFTLCLSYLMLETTALLTRGQPGMNAIRAGLEFIGIEAFLGSITLFVLFLLPIPQSIRLPYRLSAAVILCTGCLLALACLFPRKAWSEGNFDSSSAPRGLLSFRQEPYRNWQSSPLYHNLNIRTDWPRLARECAAILTIGLGSWIIIRRREQSGLIPIPFHLQFRPASTASATTGEQQEPVVHRP
ncbi:MAG TPA: hypothetical protein VGH19_18260 [Verrucomicrobiae bacterium]